MKFGQRVTVYQCPACGNDLALVEIIGGQTRLGTLLGHTFIKCKSGCSKRKILYSGRKYRPRKPLPDEMFLEMIAHARSLGKRISTADKDRELSIKMRQMRAVR